MATAIASISGLWVADGNYRKPGLLVDYPHPDVEIINDDTGTPVVQGDYIGVWIVRLPEEVLEEIEDNNDYNVNWSEYEA